MRATGIARRTPASETAMNRRIPLLLAGLLLIGAGAVGTFLVVSAEARTPAAAPPAPAGVTLADVRSVLSAEGPTAFGDFSHFTDQGSGVAAGVLARSVIESLTSAGAPTCR